MKKLISVLMLCLIFSLAFSHAITRSTAVAQVDSLYKSEQANYMIGRYVIGSGGIIGATSANQRHHATVGQTLVGGMQGTNNILLSGFWLPGGGSVGIQSEETMAMPTEFKLHQNYPNPFNLQTTIQYELPSASLVSIEIFNPVGQRIYRLNSQLQGPGYYQVVWNGLDDTGKTVGSGIYFYRITASALSRDEKNQTIQFQQTKKVLLVK